MRFQGQPRPALQTHRGPVLEDGGSLTRCGPGTHCRGNGVTSAWFQRHLCMGEGCREGWRRGASNCHCTLTHTHVHAFTRRHTLADTLGHTHSQGTHTHMHTQTHRDTITTHTHAPTQTHTHTRSTLKDAGDGQTRQPQADPQHLLGAHCVSASPRSIHSARPPLLRSVPAREASAQPFLQGIWCVNPRAGPRLTLGAGL